MSDILKDILPVVLDLTEDGDGIYVLNRKSDGRQVCELQWFMCGKPDETARYIATTINAYPDLVEALENLTFAVDQVNAAMGDGVNVQGAVSTLIGCQDMAKSKLAKAKGEQS